MPEDNQTTETTDNKATETKENPPKAKHQFVLDEEAIELDDDQLKKAAAIGLQTLKQREIEKNKKSETKETKETKTEETETDDQKFKRETREYMARQQLREQQEVAARKDAAKLAQLEEKIDEHEELKEYKDIVTERVIAQFALNQRKGINKTFDQIAEEVIKNTKERIPKRIDVQGKTKTQKDLGAGVTSGKGTAPSGENKPLGRSAFKDGSLNKRVAQTLSTIGEEVS